MFALILVLGMGLLVLVAASGFRRGRFRQARRRVAARRLLGRR